MEEITPLSLNNPSHHRVKLFFGVSVDLDIIQLKLLWKLGMSSDPDLVKEGRTSH